MMKSVTVAVTRLFRHTRVGKTVRETKKYMVRHGRDGGVAKAQNPKHGRRRHTTS